MAAHGSTPSVCRGAPGSSECAPPRSPRRRWCRCRRSCRPRRRRRHSPEAKPRDALTIAREKLDVARADADDAAARLSAIEGDRAQVATEISALEIEIPQLQARAVELKVIVKHRAASLYTRSGGGPLDAFMNADGALEAATATHLTSVVTAHDVDLAAELRATAAKLATREASLRAKRVELDHSIELVSATRVTSSTTSSRSPASAYDKVKVAVAVLRAKNGNDRDDRGDALPGERIRRLRRRLRRPARRRHHARGHRHAGRARHRVGRGRRRRHDPRRRAPPAATASG